ncbi:MAG: peptidase, partial [Gemmatimonadota bacterium]|nr:peptidase [Gemmatimonadota bacterium]
VSAGGLDLDAGAFYVSASDVSARTLSEWATELGLSFTGVADTPSGQAMELVRPRIGLWDQYGGSMPSGWIRYILEDFEFDYDVIYPPEIDRGDLSERYDVIILPDGALGEEERGFGREPDEDFLASLPDSLRSRIGRLTPGTSAEALRAFMDDGGTVVAIGSSTSLGVALGLPIRDHLVDSSGEPVSRDDYFTPGSVHDIKLEHGSPLTHGLGERAFVLHSHSPVYDIEAGAAGIRRIGWYDSAEPLVSGWAWGQERLEGGTAMLEADVGDGKLFLFGPKITFRAQPHGTFPLLFNGIYYGPAIKNRPVS